MDDLKWPTCYKGAKNVSAFNKADTLLNANSVFIWETMESGIKQFETNRLLAWESKKKSIHGYHVW